MARHTPRHRPRSRRGRSFSTIVSEELARVPERFASRIENLAVLIEDAPTPETLAKEGLGAGETLLGLYRGVPASERGEFYSGALPDTITLYRLPLLVEANELLQAGRAANTECAVRLAVRETLWHELGHHFGLSEDAVDRREDEGTNTYPM